MATAVKNVADTMLYCKTNNIAGSLLLVDFSKAFDKSTMKLSLPNSHSLESEVNY